MAHYEWEAGALTSAALERSPGEPVFNQRQEKPHFPPKRSPKLSKFPIAERVHTLSRMSTVDSLPEDEEKLGLLQGNS